MPFAFETAPKVSATNLSVDGYVYESKYLNLLEKLAGILVGTKSMF